MDLELKQVRASLRQEVTQRNSVAFEERQTQEANKRPVFLVNDFKYCMWGLCVWGWVGDVLFDQQNPNFNPTPPTIEIYYLKYIK